MMGYDVRKNSWILMEDGSGVWVHHVKNGFDAKKLPVGGTVGPLEPSDW